ncbi:DNA cytosine methyltransferase [Paracoccaceae bacterium Fryx2]|nr:DNA cytosine methyltransferase [Paracoccaceae bacterium Fryx2]
MLGPGGSGWVRVYYRKLIRGGDKQTPYKKEVKRPGPPGPTKQFQGVIVCPIPGPYPCQPFSAAGKRGGVDDARHLWPEVARVIRECAPEWVFLENVAGHVSLGLETALREL